MLSLAIQRTMVYNVGKEMIAMIEIEGVKLYDVKETAEMLHITSRSVATWCRAGSLKGTKVGAKWYVSGEELRRFLKEGKRVKT